jgi:hypothetical protein
METLNNTTVSRYQYRKTWKVVKRKMPKIKVEIAESLPEPAEGHIYVIGEAELFTSQVRGYKGLRVPMVDVADNSEVVAALWMREVAGSMSKLGAFVSVLGEDTDSWTNKKIQIVAWRQGNRKIGVIQ